MTTTSWKPRLLAMPTALISGDSDLLVLQQIGSIPILSVADFLSNSVARIILGESILRPLHYPQRIHEPCPLRQLIHPLW